MGLLSFAAIAQIAPAFLGGLLWSRATARGAIAGLVIGIVVWAYTLLIPSLDTSYLLLDGLVSNGPLGMSYLKPTALLESEMPPLVHGTFWSLTCNILAFIGFSLTRTPSAIERLQSQTFVGPSGLPLPPSYRLWSGGVTVRELQATVGRYLGVEHTRLTYRYQGRDFRLTDIHGELIKQVLA
jgi:Na+/proline symporter